MPTHAENIHHNLPDNLEIIDPKTLGLSGTDLEEFLGNVKLLPLEGEFGGTGSPKAQILTVGFDGSEKLNLQDFESLSTTGLADADKHVAEMAFKKFQNFFQNPKSAKNFDEIRDDESTEYTSNSDFATTTPTTTSTTVRGGTRNVKQKKRVKNGKRPIFSSTFRTFSDSTPEIITTTQRYRPIELQNYPTSSSTNSFHHKYPHHDLNQHQHQYQNQYHSTFTNQAPTTFVQSDLSNSQIQRPKIQPMYQLNNQGNYVKPSSQFSQHSSTVNSINQVRYNVEGFGQNQNIAPQFQQHPKRIILKQANQNALRASEQQKYPYVAKQSHFTLKRPQQGSRTLPSVKPQGRNPTRVRSHQQQNSQFQYQQPVQNSMSTSDHQIPVFQTSNQIPNFPVTQQYYQKHHGGSTTQAQQYNTQQSIQHNQPYSAQYRQQKQIPLSTSSPNSQIQIRQMEQHKQVQDQQNFQFQQDQQQQQQQHQNFQVIQQHRLKSLETNQNQINQNFYPSQLDPLQPPQKMGINHVVPSKSIQILRNPKNVHYNKQNQQEQHGYEQQAPSVLHQQQQQVTQFIGFPLSSTPKSVPMSGIFQITPSTPLVTISTVENAMTAHKTIMQQRHEVEMMTKQRELTHNQIPGSSQPILHTPDSKPHFQVETQKQVLPGHFQDEFSKQQQHQRFPQQQQQRFPQQQHQQQQQQRFPQQQRPPPAKEFRNQGKGQQTQNIRTQFPHPRLPPPPPPPPQKYFRQDPNKSQGHPTPRPLFLSEEFRHNSAPPPPPLPEFRHSKSKNQISAPFGFNNLIDQRFPMLKFQRIPHVLENESRPPHGASMIRAMPVINFNHHVPPRSYQPELQLRLAPPSPYEMRSRFPQTVASHEDPNLHNEANTYTRNLGLNVQSINSAPLISSFIA